MAFKLNLQTINYGGELNNILEFFSNDLEQSEQYKEALTDFTSFSYNSLMSIIGEEIDKTLIQHTPLLEEDNTKPLVTLVKERKLHWDADNKVPNRPNAISYSGTTTKVSSPKELVQWYSTNIDRFTTELQKEADEHTDGNIDYVKGGLLTYDLLCNHIYQKHKLHLVRKTMIRTNDKQENSYQIAKFGSVIQPLMGADIVAVQECLDFSQLNTTWMCFKSYVLNSSKTIMNGVPNSKISLILGSELAKNTTLLDTPSITGHQYLKKTSCFNVKHQGKNVLLVVVHMKNPKEEAASVASDLKALVDGLKSKDTYDYHVVLGDTNLEAKNKYTTENFAEDLDMAKAHNVAPTTYKKRTFLQSQVGKADQLSSEEKDVCFYSKNLKEENTSLYPVEEHDKKASVYPNLNPTFYPKPDWPTDHRALGVTLFDVPAIITNV